MTEARIVTDLYDGDGPLVWPVCPVCHTACVLRRCFAFGANSLTDKWMWQRDCKHKGRVPMDQFMLYNADGPIEQGATNE